MNDDYVKKWVMKAINDLNVAKHELAQPESEMVTDANRSKLGKHIIWNFYWNSAKNKTLTLVI